jgi:geranylgeranyl diphosphate synthase type 3
MFSLTDTLSDVLQKRTTSYALKKHIVEYLTNHTRSFEYTRGVLDTLYAQIEDEVKSLGGNAALEGIIGLLKVPGK